MTLGTFDTLLQTTLNLVFSSPANTSRVDYKILMD